MKRFLAGILSAVLIIGSIPVYGAENQEIAPQAENIQNTELQQSPEESDHGDSLGDAEGAVEENNPEESDNSIRNPEEIPAVHWRTDGRTTEKRNRRGILWRNAAKDSLQGKRSGERTAPNR